MATYTKNPEQVEAFTFKKLQELSKDIEEGQTFTLKAFETYEFGVYKGSDQFKLSFNSDYLQIFDGNYFLIINNIGIPSLIYKSVFNRTYQLTPFL